MENVNDCELPIYEGYILGEDHCYTPGALTFEQEGFLNAAVIEAKMERYDRAVAQLSALLDSIKHPSGFHTLIYSDLCSDEESEFTDILNMIFQNSWDQFETLIPKLEQHYQVEYGRNYCSLTLLQDNSRPFGSSFSFRRDLTHVSYQEGLSILATIPYDNDQDLLEDYLELADLHVDRREDCIEKALERIKEEKIETRSSDEDALVFYYLEQIEKEPEKADIWIAKGESRLQELAGIPFAYHCNAKSIADYYRENSDQPNLERIIKLIAENIERVENPGEKELLISLNPPELVQS